MIRDGLAGLANEAHDVCVVGAGPVGLSLALELSRLGRRVLLLESGGDGPDPDAQKLSEAHLVDPARHDAMEIAVARRLGGTSNLWGGRCLPYDPIDFAPREIVGGALWPIGFDAVAPHYARAVAYACAGAPAFESAAPPRAAGDFSASALERWSARRRLQEAHRAALTADPRIECRLHATVVGLDWRDDRIVALDAVGRDGLRAKIPVRDVVLATGGLESTRLLLAEQRRRPRLFGGSEGPLGRFYMGHVIGEIADIVFADDAVDRAFDFTIEGGSYVRRRIAPAAAMLSRENLLNCAFWPVVPRVADAGHRDGFLSAVALALSVEPIGRRVLQEAIRKRHIPPGMARGPHLANVLRDLPAAAVEVPALLWRRFGARIPAPAFYKRNAARRYGLAYHGEQAPRAASRVTLADDCDAAGLPRLRVDLRFSTDDAASVVALHERLERWLAASGLGRLEHRFAPQERAAAVLDQASHGTHQIGTARMGFRNGGVVDGDLRTFDAPNLHVLSSAVLPTSGQANPTLTVMALGMRLTQRLAAPQAAPELATTPATGTHALSTA